MKRRVKSARELRLDAEANEKARRARDAHQQELKKFWVEIEDYLAQEIEKSKARLLNGEMIIIERPVNYGIFSSTRHVSMDMWNKHLEEIAERLRNAGYSANIPRLIPAFVEVSMPNVGESE